MMSTAIMPVAPVQPLTANLAPLLAQLNESWHQPAGKQSLARCGVAVGERNCSLARLAIAVSRGASSPRPAPLLQQAACAAAKVQSVLLTGTWQWDRRVQRKCQHTSTPSLVSYTYALCSSQ